MNPETVFYGMCAYVCKEKISAEVTNNDAKLQFLHTQKSVLLQNYSAKFTQK